MRILDQKAYETFRRAYKGSKNFMTPKILEYGSAGNVYYELSEGRGIYENEIYGVTVLSKRGERMQEHNRLLPTYGEAKAYITELQQIPL